MNPHDMNPHGTNPQDMNDAQNEHMDDEALLTAFALGELEGAEHDAVAARVAADVEAQALVDEIRSMGDLLTSELATESAGTLTAEQRAAIAAAAAPVASGGRLRNLWPLVGMAASVVAGVGLATWLAGDVSARRDAESASATWGSNGPFDSVLGRSKGGRVYHYDASDRPDDLGNLPAQREVQHAHGNVELAGRRAVAAIPVDRLSDLVGSGGGGGNNGGDGYELAPNINRRDPLRDPRGGGDRTVATFNEPIEPSSVTEDITAKPGDASSAPAAPAPATFSRKPGAQPGRPSLTPATKAPKPGAPLPATTPPYLYGAGASAGGGHGTAVSGGGGSPDDGIDPATRRAMEDNRMGPLRRDKRIRRDGGRGFNGAGAAGDSEDTSVAGGGDAGGVIAGDSTWERDGDGRIVGVSRLPIAVPVLADLPRLGLALQGTAWNDVQVGGIVSWARVRGTADIKVGKLLNLIETDDELETAVAEVALEQLRRIRARDEARRPTATPNGEWYEHPGEPAFRDPTQEPLSTFSIDVDTASYANMRRFLSNGQVPPAASIRIEEMINYFPYSQAAPTGDHPIGVVTETAACPWNPRNRLVRVGLKAREIEDEPPASNLVFLVDVSGSMKAADKLPLLQRSLKLMAQQMREQDSVAVVVYASDSGVRLRATHGGDQEAIMAAFDSLAAGGSTNGGAGIQEAYRIAKENFVEGGVNRVILATDGDFNVGVTDRNQLVDMVQERAQDGVFLTVLGVGTGNLKDAQLESLADKGNGQYAYLDGIKEARKVLVDQMHGTLVTVAKDVKVQLEFNPVQVGAYRLIGYENRVLAAADFNNDKKDAGEMGAGHSVTMLYEVVPAATATASSTIDSLRYQQPRMAPSDAAGSGEMLTVKVRYKQPDGSTSVKLEQGVTDSQATYSSASADFKFASAVASFGMILRGSPSCHTTLDGVLELGTEAIGDDPGGYRMEFLDLVMKAKSLTGR